MLSVPVPYQIRTSDMTPNAARHIEPYALRSEGRGGEDNFLGNSLVFKDFLIVVDVIQEQIQRVDALFQAAFDIVPVTGFHNARHDVEREDLFGTFIAAIYGKGDAHVIHGSFCRFLAGQDLAIPERCDTFDKYSRAGSRDTSRLNQLIVKVFRIVCIEV
jgi:hypothetical protein